MRVLGSIVALTYGLARSHVQPKPGASGRGGGRGRTVEFEVENGYELTGLTHFDLLNHPDVYEQLLAWITTAGRTAS